MVNSYSLNLGGVESSLIALLNQLNNKNEFQIDLLLEKNEGQLLKEVPKNVKVLDTPDILKIFRMDKSDLYIVPIKLLLNHLFTVLFWYLFYVIVGVLKNKVGESRQLFWIKCNTYFEYSEEYDIVISFHHTVASYVVADRISSNQKFVWIHGDYSTMGRNKELDNIYLNKFDKIITVSKECEKILKNIFPKLENKIIEIPNLLSRNKIIDLSKQSYNLEKKEGKFDLVSVSRLDKNKGYDIAIPAVAKLIKEKMVNKWYIVGDGPYKKELAHLLGKNGISKDVILTGRLDNPFKIIDKCEIFLHPSRFEGKSVSVEEAKLLKKPIVITNYSTATDQIIHKYNGLIVEMSSESIYKGLKEVMNDEHLKNTVVSNLDKDYKEDIDIMSELLI